MLLDDVVELTLLAAKGRGWWGAVFMIGGPRALNGEEKLSVSSSSSSS